MTLTKQSQSFSLTRTLLFLIIIFLCNKGTEAYSCYTAIWSYGYCRWGPYCYQDSNGNYNGCSGSLTSAVNKFYKEYRVYYDSIWVYQYCHPYCETCTWSGNTNCQSCNSPYYKWVRGSICESYCPVGDYTYPGVLGEYILAGTRSCGACHSDCMVCKDSNTKCYICKNHAYLVDDKASCQIRFPLANSGVIASKTNCRKCDYIRSNFGSEACIPNNNYCFAYRCPNYFYFETTNGVNSQTGNLYGAYTDYVNGAGMTADNGQYFVYRSQTNLCILCDKRCTQCTGPTNTNCTSCANGYFKWYYQTVCSQNCPSGEYEDHYNPNPIFHDTECKLCNVRCLQCDQYPQNCTRCQGTQSTFNTNTNTGYLYTYNTSWSQCLASCPTSTTPLSTKGYYGSINTMICYQCPGGCSNCNIDITRNDANIWCTDIYCSEGISCTTCLLGYALVSGKCVDQKSCLRYAYYLPGNASTQWSPDKCFCLRGYFMSSYVSCDTLCDYKCKTCNGPGSAQCTSCEQGYTLSSGSCVSSQLIRSHYFSIATGFTYFSLTSPVSTSTCGGHTLLWGYQQTAPNKQFFYQSDQITVRNYYGVSAKMRIMFIDKWSSTGAIWLKKDSTANQPAWTWTYNNYGAYGEQGCGTNDLDYLMTLNAEYFYQPTTDYVTFYVGSNSDLYATYPQWGIKDVLVTVLACNSVCATCTGPLATNCLTCSDTNRRVVNNTCTCNTATGFYEQGTLCTTTCNSGYYKDPITAKCVLPTSCTAPNRFGDPTTGFCVQACPLVSGVAYFAQNSTKMCVTNCGTYNQYKYQGGAQRSCEDVCPTNFIAYGPATTSLWTCVAKCPAGWYFQLQNRLTNPKCVDTCPTGWQDEDLAECVNDCPNGYFKQNHLLENRCMKTCYASFGNNITGHCVTLCPPPYFGDPTTQLCLKDCADTYFRQIQIAAPNNRTCTLVCETNQWGNPFTRICVRDPMLCPIGYFADDNTHLCQKVCTVLGQVGQNTTRKCQTSCLTGFAHWDSKVCVNICPSNPSMFSYVSGALRVCVSSCNSSSTGLFGDVQANRSCVSKCTASPTPTFGQVSTNLCVPNCSVATQFGDPLHSQRRCVTTCTTNTFSYSVNKLCVPTCPDLYYGDNYTVAGKGVCATGCPSPYFGDPVSHLCVATCPTGYFGSPLTGRPCLLKCPLTYYGQNKTGNRVCVQTCDNGFWADEMTRLCTNVKAQCSNNTYADASQKKCVVATSCSVNSYADPFTKGCQSACSNSLYFGDPNTHTCVTLCSQVPEQYSQNGYCVTGCTGGLFADYQDNRKCNVDCSRSPVLLYGNKVTWKCVKPINCPANHFADNLTLTCVATCAGTLPFGDPISLQCVSNCPDNYYGDWALNKCVLTCPNATARYADNITGNCQPVCSSPTYGVNSSTAPVCQKECPSGQYAKDGIRVCVSDCGFGFYGDPITRKCYSDPILCSPGYYGNSVSNLCVLPANCQTVGTHYFAQNSTKTCVSQCLSPNFGDSVLWTCISVCNNTSFGETTTRLCLTGCSTYLTYAEPQNHLCVDTCLASPIGHFSQNDTYTCVEARKCPINMYAENTTRKCVFYCPKTPVMTYADVYVTKFCVLTCPDTYYADDSIVEGGQCVINCAGQFRFRQNSTKSCVSICPLSQGTFGDTVGDMCVKTCPDGYFAQQDTNRRCVLTCAANSWGNKITKICIKNPLTQCPPNTWADDDTHICEQICSSTPSTYGNNATKKCVASCPSPSFAYDITRVCIDICPPSLLDTGYFGDPDLTPTRKCVKTCQTPNLYRDIQASRTCKSSCTFNSTYKTYKDPTTMSCEAVCSNYPQMRYADDFSQSCQLSCANGGLRKSDKTRSCVSTCSVLYEPNDNLCVQKCPKHSILGVPLYADLTLKRCVQFSDCPSNTYASDDSMQCVSSCPNGTFVHGKQCVYYCPDNYFMDKVNRKCVTPLNCPLNTYADYLTRSCVSKCNGNFANKNTKICVDVCPPSFYADPITSACQTSCSTGFVKNVDNRTCLSDCATGLYKNPKSNACSNGCVDPNFADDTSRSCVPTCTSNPLTFASTSSGRKCVSACLPTEWHDLSLRKCVSTCPSTTYAYEFNRSCVLFCPGPSHYALGSQCVTNCSVQTKYSDDSSRTCVGVCPTGFYKDPTTFKCVQNCPNTYYKSDTLNSCTQTCPEGTYSDQQQGKCVTQCSISPPMFAQQTYNQCIMKCPVALSSFADYTTYKCVTQCPSGYFADNRTRQCKVNCSDWYADSNKVPKACTSFCQLGTYSDQTTFKCVGKCPANYWAHQTTRKCVQFCPHGLFSDNSTSKCVQKCPSAFPYADSLTRSCVTSCTQGQFGFLATGTNQWGTCVRVCPSGTFSNPLNFRCVTQCPVSHFSQTVNNTCAKSCPHDKYKDSVNRKCVTQCPAANLLFGNRFTKQCVLSCDPALEIYADTLTRFCQQTCSGDQYKTKDINGKNVCVSKTGCLNGLFADPYMKACVSECYNNTFGYNGVCYEDCPTSLLFANTITKTCVTAQNCPDGYFADATKKMCVQFCDKQTQTFADTTTKSCTKACVSPYYADNSTRTCTLKCPDVPELFARSSDRVCVQKCPPDTFADQLTNKCELGCQLGYYADQSTWKCVKKCPQGKFGDNSTNYCVSRCPQSQSYFGNPDPQNRTCVKTCPDGTFADPNNNRECRPYCLPPLFSQNLTHTCEPSCKTGFANQRTRQCIQVCTSGYYGYAGVCYKYQCPLTAPSIYADDSTNLCVTSCPQTSYGDLSTRKCVKICPVSQKTYADEINNLCVTSCPGNTFADNSTRKCVTRCPQVPALFASPNQKACLSQCTFDRYADNSTRSCVTVTECPSGTYADNTTMKCVAQCPSKPMMYGYDIIKKCVLNCPAQYDHYAENVSRTCVRSSCPEADNTFADPVKRACVSTCSLGYFAINSSRVCRTTCPDGQFADVLLRKCVAKCSINPVYYGNRLTKQCVTQCPPNSYGNPQTQQCVFDNTGISTCPDGYFGDDSSRLCVKKCSMKLNLYGDPLIKKCKSSCSDPNYFKDNSTMLCVTKCPSYPNYFADLNLKTCVAYCPSQRWADDDSRVCVSQCPPTTFAENSTWRCLKQCLKNPLTFGDSSAWRCVTKCPQGTFADYSTFKCVSKCPLQDSTFAENTTRVCVKNCPGNTYAQNTTRICVSSCWGTDLADSSSNKCVQKCPSYPALYGHFEQNICLSMCPLNFFAYEKDRTCVDQCPQVGLYRQNTTRRCLKSCLYNESEYADDLTGFCVKRCSQNTWSDPTTHKCVQKCPDQPLMYASNGTQQCVSTCPAPFYGDNQTRSCVDKCPSNSLSLEAKHLCVRYCPVGYFAYVQTAFCVQICPQPYYGDPSTRTCVLQCPAIQLLYADNSTRTCVKTCPSLSYADKKSKFCVLQCPLAEGQQAQTYAADYNNRCVEQCALPTFAFEPTLKCYNKCPDPYYNNVTDHKCYKCPAECTSCSSPTQCQSCITNRYLQTGQCVSQCSGLYYANLSTMKCVISSLCKPFFAVNSTNKCTAQCPVGQWANLQVFRCDACPSTCISCSSLSKCSACKENSIFYADFCYGFCFDSLKKYYSSDNKTCLTECNNGTYLEALFCKPCASSCTTCFNTATNCTLCSGGLYLQDSVCVPSCNIGYKPNTNRLCVSCGDQCDGGLTFNTNITEINGQANIFMNFNSGVNILGDLYNVIQVQTTTRRLLVGQVIENNLSPVGASSSSAPPPYTIQIVDQKTIRIIFPPGYTAQDYQIKIVAPELIQDQFGNIPSNTRAQIIVDSSQLYSTSVDQVTNGFTIWFSIISIVSIVSFLYDTEMLRFLQLIYVHYFVIMNLPPQLTKVLTILKTSTIDYIPSIYGLPQEVLKFKVQGKIYDLLGDYSFLRNSAASITILVVLLLIFLILKLLSLPEVNRHKRSRVWINEFINQKWTFAIWIQALLIMSCNLVFNAVLQMRDYTMYDSFASASIVIAHIFVIFVVVVLGLLLYKVGSFFNSHPDLSQNLKKASDIILKDEELKLLNSSNIFLFEKKKIDLRNLMYPKINNVNILPYRCSYRFNFLSVICPIVVIFRMTLLAFIMTFASSTIMQMSLAIPLNVLALLYFIRARPYSFKERKYRIKNYMAIFNEVSLIIFELLMLALGIMQRDSISSSQKQSFASNIVYFLTAVTVPNFIYFMFRTVIFVQRKVWIPFIESQLFKKNFPQRWAKYQQQKNNQNKVSKRIDPMARQAIKSLLKGFKQSHSLRPTQKDKLNPQLPVKHKLTFFDRDSSSVASSNTSMTRKQKKKMLKDLFSSSQDYEKQLAEIYEQVNNSESQRASQIEYEQYEEQFEVKARDLSKYVANAQEILRLIKAQEDSEME